MKSKKLKILLIILVNIIWIQFTAQNQNDSITCLENRKLDFLIEYHLRAKHLANDTTNLGQQNRDLYSIIHQDNNQIDYLLGQIIIKDTLINRRDNFVIDLNKKYNKEQKKTKFYKNTTIIFMSTTAILILVGMLLVK